MTDSNHLSAFIRLAQHRDLSGSTFIGFSLCTAGNAEYILAGKPLQACRRRFQEPKRNVLSGIQFLISPLSLSSRFLNGKRDFYFLLFFT